MWSASVINRTLITNPSQSLLEREFICDLQFLTKCPIEQQRFLAMDYWVRSFPNMKWRGSTLTAFLDQMMRNASSYKPNFLFSEKSINIESGVFFVDSFKENSFGQAKATNSSLNLYRSSSLTINSQTAFVRNDYVFSRFTLLFSPTNSVPKQSVYNLTVNKAHMNKNNGYFNTNFILISLFLK